MKKTYFYILGGGLLIVILFWLFLPNIPTGFQNPKDSSSQQTNALPLTSHAPIFSDTNTTGNLNVILLYDPNTADSVEYQLTDTWEDGSEMNSSKADGIVYINRNGRFYKRKFEGPVMASWFGAKGDGKTDDTKSLQKLFNSDYSHIALEKKTYLVSKNNELSGFPNKDQPCLLLINKNNVIVEGNNATLMVKEHAQGILEIQRSRNLTISNLNFIGSGKFPSLDSNTGRGEKGTKDQGYYTSGFWGYYKNNSNNTSSQKRGGFSGKFPQFGGGTGDTWGMWNNGYIGNVSYGLLIHNDCHEIVINTCTAKSFNYVGIGVGHNGDFFPKDLGYKKSTNITFKNCKAESNYGAGFHSMDVKGFNLLNSVATNSGHPEASKSDKNIDPGYGYTSRGSRKYTTDGLVEGSRFSSNRRKGLDVHAGSGITFRNNSISGSWVGGIFAAWSNKNQPASNIKIINNTIDNCGDGPGSLGAIYVGADGSESSEYRELNAIIDNNKITNYSKTGIWVRYGRGVQISNNSIENAKQGVTSNLSGILILGLNENDNAGDIKIIKNTIKDVSSNMPRGIQLSHTNSSTVESNIIEFEKDANIGLYTVKSSGLEVTNNQVTIKGKGTAIAVPQSVGKVLSNTKSDNN
ncbi:right-handed parallel beta-helix repeat-containing protein [Parapedobacter sp.]